MRNANGARRRGDFTTGAILFAVTAAAALGGCAAKDAGTAGAVPPEPSRKEQLAGGFQAFDERRYDDAIQAAEHVLASDSAGPGSA